MPIHEALHSRPRTAPVCEGSSSHKEQDCLPEGPPSLRAVTLTLQEGEEGIYHPVLCM